jgi:hypothetical protein
MIIQPDGKITVIGWAFEQIPYPPFLTFKPRHASPVSLQRGRTPDGDFGIAGVELVKRDQYQRVQAAALASGRQDCCRIH